MDNSLIFEEIGYSGAVFKNIAAVEQNWSLRPNYYGYMDKSRPDNGLIIIVSDLTAVFTLADGKTVTAQKGDVVFAPSGTKYKVDFTDVSDRSATHSYTVNFEMQDTAGNELCDPRGLRIIAHDRKNEFEPLAYKLSVVCNDIKNNQLRIMSKFCALLDAVISSQNERGEQYYPIRRGIDVLTVEWNKNERISRYAELCSVSESYFHTLFKKWSGMSPVDYRNRLRVAHAKSILQNSDLSVGEISHLVGFEDQFYFSRVFKTVTGMSPQKYRKE